MEVSRELLFFFSALGAFNGLLMALYFIFIAKPKHISNVFLGLFLLMLSIRIGKSVFFYFNPDLAFSYLQFGLTGCLFIGPFLYFYVKSVVSKTDTSVVKWTYKTNQRLLKQIRFITNEDGNQQMEITNSTVKNFPFVKNSIQVVK